MIVLRLNDIALYAAVGPNAKNGQVAREYSLCVKRRYYLVQIREYMSLFKDIKDGILAQTSLSGLAKPYAYNGVAALEGDEPYVAVEEAKEGVVTQD